VIVCPKCSKQNQDHYKFCLGCGTELGAPRPGSAVPPSSPRDEESDLELVGSALDEPTLPPTEPPEEGTPLASVGSDEAISAQSASTGSAPCPECSTPNPVGFTFCGNCGARLKKKSSQQTLFKGGSNGAPSGDQQQGSPIAQIFLIRPDGTPDGSHTLHQPEEIIGRDTGKLFTTDGYLSPRHARFFVSGQDNIMVEDLGSANGVFMRIEGEEVIEDGDIFRVGQELLRFDAIRAPQPADDGTEILGSPNPGYWGRLSLIVGRGVDGSAFPLMGQEMILGRERGDILFSDDGYVSATHAKVSLASDGSIRLADMGSSNGTFIRLNAPRRVSIGTFVLMGQQLFRLETV